MLDSKLQLLDKTLAESKTELEIMKGYYSLFANNRTAYKQMSHPIKLSSAERSNMHFNRSLDSNSVHTRYAVPMSSMTKVQILLHGANLRSTAERGLREVSLQAACLRKAPPSPAELLLQIKFPGLFWTQT